MPKLKTSESAKKRKVIEDLFIENGVSGLKGTLKLLRDRDGLTKTVKNYVEAQKEFEGGSVALDITGPENVGIHRMVRVSANLRPFISEKLVAMNGGDAIVDPEVETLLAAFLEQLNNEDQKSL
jgi:hypothetical protein